MGCYLELKSEHGFSVMPGDFFETSILLNPETNELSAGRDEFGFHTQILPGKRAAGFGRSKKYRLEDLPCGLGIFEADSSPELSLKEEDAISFILSTNIFLDMGELAAKLSLSLKRGEKHLREIPLNSPAVEIDWLSRGKYAIVVPV